MKKILLFILAVCTAGIVVAQQYVIKAHVTGFNNRAKFYLKDIDADADIDSAVIQNDHFVLKGKLAETPQSLWLYSQTGKNYYYVTLMIGNEDININGDIKDFPFDLSVTGSKTQDEHNILVNLTKEDYKKRNILVGEFFALKGDSSEIKGRKIWKVISKIDSVDDVARINFIKNNLNSYEALSELFYLKNKYPKDTLQQMYNSLMPEFKQSR